MNTKHRIQRDGLMQPRLFLLILALVCTVDHASAAGPLATDETNLIQINLESTRPELTVGTGLGIMAEITNLSRKNTIYLTEKDLTLTPAPELINPAGDLVAWWAYFPNLEKNQLYRFPGEMTPYYYAVAELKPGGKITAFWWNPRGRLTEKEPPVASAGDKPLNIVQLIKETRDGFLETWDAILTELRFMFFSPGDYKVTVSTKYWLNPERPGSGNYHNASKTFHASAPQSVILFGAAIGGLLAYFILPQARRRFIESAQSPPPWARQEFLLHGAIRRIFHEIGGAVAAILLSTIVTILLSRISETQFLIRVTVSDIWGAITIGFVANYAGSTILAKILNKVSPLGSGVKGTRPPIKQQGGKLTGTQKN